MNQFIRTEALLGAEGMARLKQSTVAVFGIGGVGSFAAEALARSGVGKLILCDKDVVDITNLNRQLIADHTTIGKYKTEVMAERIKNICPDTEVELYNEFYGKETDHLFPFEQWDYVVDAIDTVSSKLLLITRAKTEGIPVISSMGAGNKLDPTKFLVADISKTSVCPLAKVMRTELRKRGIKDVKVVYSTEIPVKSRIEIPGKPGRLAPASIAFVPSVAGLIMAGQVIRDIALKE